MRCTNWSSHRLRSLTGSLALYSSLVSSVLKKLLTLGWPARSTEPTCRLVLRCIAPRCGSRAGIEFARRRLDHSRKHVRFRIRTHAGPWRLTTEMRLGEVSLASRIEEVLDSVEIEKERRRKPRRSAGQCG